MEKEGNARQCHRVALVEEGGVYLEEQGFALGSLSWGYWCYGLGEERATMERAIERSF